MSIYFQRIKTMGVKNSKNAMLYVAIGIVMLLTFIRDMLGLNVNQYAILAIVSAFLLLLNKQQCVNYTFFLLSLLSGIQGLSVTIASIVLLVKTKRINPISCIFIIFILLLETFNSISYSSNNQEFARVMILYSSNIFLFFYLLYYNSKDLNVIEPIKYFLIGSTFVMFVILVRSLMVGGIQELIFEATRIGNRELFDEIDNLGTEFQMNPNSLAFYSLFTLSVILVFKKQLGIITPFFYIIFSIALLAGILSFSRTWILCVVVFLVLFFIGNLSNWQTILIGGLMVLIIVFAFGNFLDMVLGGFSNRFQEGDFSEAGGRKDLFSQYNQWIIANGRSISGIGILYYKDITHIIKGSHSGLQQIFIAYGFVGLLLFGIASIIYIKMFLRNFSFAALLPFLICFIFDQSIQFLSNPILLFPFVMLAYTLRIDPVNYYRKRIFVRKSRGKILHRIPVKFRGQKSIKYRIIKSM